MNPHTHDPGDRFARTDFLQQQIARHLEQDIADIKQADAQSITRIGQVQIALKLQFGEADIDAIDVVQDVADEDEGDDPQDHLPVKTAFPFICRNRKTPGLPLQNPLLPRVPAGTHGFACVFVFKSGARPERDELFIALRFIA